MIQHKFEDIGDRHFCRYCGALYHAAMTATCIERPDPKTAGMMPEPKRRAISCEDTATISKRMTEIDAERLEAINTPSKE